ncbi:MAG: amidohydrolase [Deltaproteobacteria bacterium]|nr:amidohydrolase [Deltaproteobacteria bacterium]
MEENKSGTIDLHVHIFPDRMFEAVWKRFKSLGWGFQEEYIEQIRQTLIAHGVVRAAGLSYAHKAGVAGSLNRFMETLGRSDPMFLPFASVYPNDDDFRQTVDHAIESSHLYGFKFQPLAQLFDVNDARLDYLYERCLERDFPITMHIGSGPTASELVGINHFRKLIRRFEMLRICVPHMGWTEFDEFLRLMDDHPNMFFDTAVINIVDHRLDSRYPVPPQRLARYADRICFGSDWPFVHYDYQTSLDSVKRFGFSPEDCQKVMYDNAVRFLKIDIT